MNLDLIQPSSRFRFGEIDWYGNAKTGGQYGFIKEADGQDYFFVRHSSSGFDPSEGAIVVFKVISSSRHLGKHEAIHIFRLSDVTDPYTLIYFAFLKQEYRSSTKYLHAAALQYGQVAAMKQWSGPEILSHFADNGLLSKDKSQYSNIDSIIPILNFLCAGLSANMQEDCLGLLLIGYSDAEITAGYLDNKIKYGRHIVNCLLREWFKFTEAQHDNLIFNARSDPTYFLTQYSHIVLPRIRADKNYNITNSLIAILQRLDWNNSTDVAYHIPESIIAIFTSASIEQKLCAYHKKYFSLDRHMLRWLIRDWSDLSHVQKQQIISDSKIAELPILDDIVDQLLSPLAAAQPYNAFYLFRDLLTYFPDQTDYLRGKIVSNNKICIIKLLLWIYELGELSEPLAYGIFVSGLKEEDQRLFLKKLIASMLNNIDHSLLDILMSWVWTDISTWVVLEIIHSLLHKSAITQQSVLGYIITHIDSPEDDLVIDGYFDKCLGRGYFNRDEEFKRASVPQFVKWCEGRILPPKYDNNGASCNKHQAWWCANQRCYGTSIVEREPAEYREYTLWNIMKSFGVTYSRLDYELLLGMLNRIHHIMEKVKCRDCNHIMHPVRQSNYSFYRITRFRCANSLCSNRDEVYLNHCINGNCSNIIDSRDSVRCRPHGYSQQKCGWFICNYCYSCCNTQKLQRRKEILESAHRVYTCHLEGHRDLREICCLKCGTVMHEVSSQNVREWLFKHENDFKCVAKKGMRRDGGKWYLIKKSCFENIEDFKIFINNAYKCGYQVPDRENENKDVYLIGEPLNNEFNPIMQCPECEHILDIDRIVKDNQYQHLGALRVHEYVNIRYPKKHQRA